MGSHRITLAQGVALYVGAVLGTGVIALPAMAAGVAGPASLVAWAGLVVLSAPLAAVFAALAGRYPDAGGVASFAQRAFGWRAAAVTGWWFYFAVMVGYPAAGLFGGAYVASAVGGGTATVLAVCAVLMAATIAANLVGLRLSGRLQLGLSSALAALIVLAVLVSAPGAEAAHLQPFAPHGWLAVGSAAALLVWAFAGWETVTHLSGEFAAPERDIPRAAAIAVVVVGSLYLGLAAVTVLVLGPGAGDTQAPLAVLLARGIGGSAKIAGAVAAVTITLGTMNVYISSSAKLGAALGREGTLPRWMARGNATGQVPRRSIGVLTAGSTVSLTLAAALGVGAEPLVLATSALLVAVYAVGVAAGLRLLPRGGPGWWAAATALPLVLLVLAMSGWYLLAPVVFAGAALIYLRYGRRAARHPADLSGRLHHAHGHSEATHTAEKQVTP